MSRSGVRRAALRLARRVTHRRLDRDVVLPARDLIAQGRFDEADALLEAALDVDARDPALLHAYATSAHDSGRYRAAITRWQAAVRVAGDDPTCHACLAANYREIGEFDLAHDTIAAAERMFPHHLSIVTEAARIAETTGRFADAMRYWREAAAKRRPSPEWLRGYAHALVMVGDFEAAQRVLDRALERHPAHRGLVGVRGILAYARGDWSTAIAHWTAYRQLFPDDKTGWEHLGRALEAQALEGRAVETADAVAHVTAPARQAAPARIATIDDEAMRDLMLRFESIGDSCELGGVQRRFSAEPLGLLRWNEVGLPGLLAGLAARFDGMGEPANTELAVLDNGEFFVRDRRWNLGMHTFFFAGQTDHAALYPKMCRRVAFLRDKFLSDLDAAEKIFVFRSPGLDADDLATLHAALGVYGPIKLLSVQPGTPEPGATPFHGGPGDVIEVDERRAVGFLGRLGVADGGYWDIAFEDWVSVCGKAAAMM